ncbi:MAG: alanyl-tRNA editing protein [Candidatus Latescibacterota bacterium]|nr:MAG: alanyl-tRNA editing protein [Candidatus Latescibacterota bacterium]
METEKRYLTDPYTTNFKALPLSCRPDDDGRIVAIFESTYFYPESGGQPADRGSVGGVDVVDVYEDESGTVCHVLDGDPSAGDSNKEIECQIDWDRRFDHMQQHTGQHILSRAFIEVAGLETVSFHLGEETCTIDLEGGKLTDDIIGLVENLSNSIVWENRDVRATIKPPSEVEADAYRRSPPEGIDEIRLVEIDRFDTNACCGTHVRRTGELGMIKVLRYEKAKGAYRVYFEVGRRAYDDFVQKHEIIKRLAGSFTTAVDNVEGAVDKLRSDCRRVKKEAQQLAKQLAVHEADRLYSEGRRTGDLVFIVELVAEKSEDYVRLLASCLKSKENTVSLLGTRDGLIVCNAPSDAGIDFSTAVIDKAKSLGGSGGGKGGFATARLPESVSVKEFLEKVFENVKDT